MAVVLGLFVAEICHDYQPVKLSALLVVLFWVPLIALHEAGHAVVASLLNWYVGQVVIGMGRLLTSFRVGTPSSRSASFRSRGLSAASRAISDSRNSACSDLFRRPRR